MTKHMFRCYIGRGEMDVSPLETRINDWVANNGEWVEDPAAHTLTETNTELDGSGETYYAISVRFHQDDTKANILQKFTDKLKNKVDWYRVGHHVCDHDESGRSGCSWDETRENGSVPADIPTFGGG